jgi:hypothetical protein
MRGNIDHLGIDEHLVKLDYECVKIRKFLITCIYFPEEQSHAYYLP